MQIQFLRALQKITQNIFEQMTYYDQQNVFKYKLLLLNLNGLSSNIKFRSNMSNSK
jgi:hypothetical protein